MKKQLLLAGGAVAAAFVMTGCMATHTNDATATVQFNVEKDFKADVMTSQQAVSGEATVHNLFGLISWGVSDFADDAFVTTNASPLQLAASPLTIAKQGATYNACESAKADVILAAKYKIDVADFFVYKTVKCKVTGDPGTIKGVK